MTEDQLLKVFEEYKGYGVEDFDITGCFEFRAFCAGYKFRDDFPTEYGTITDLPKLPKK